jgi:protein KIAA0825
VANDFSIVVVYPHAESDPNVIVRSKKTVCQILAECICAIDEDNKHTELLAALVNQSVESQKRAKLDTDLDEAGADSVSGGKETDMPGSHNHEARSDEEYDVENADYISEVLASDVLTTSVGKQSVKMMYKYIKHNVEFLLQQLNVSDVEPDPTDEHPGQRITEMKPDLLNVMFHIGIQPFDQWLTGKLNIDFMAWLQTPMSLTPERAWLQVCQRHEFQENVQLSAHEALMVQSVTSQLKK